MIGRAMNVDFMFNSNKVAREMLEIITGPGGTSKTSLFCRVLTRAKCTINGKVEKLSSKDSKPREIDYTNESKIIIETVSSKESQAVLPDHPIIIEWVEFNLFSREFNDELKIARRHGVDFKLVDNVNDATHYYCSNGDDENMDEFRIAVMKGIPVLNSNWLELTLGHDEDVTVDSWLLNVNYEDYLPNGDRSYIPKDRSGLFEDLKVVSFQEIAWIESIVIDEDNFEEEIRRKVGDSEFILINSENKHGIESTTEDQLWESVKRNVLDNVKSNSIKQIKRPAMDSEIIPDSLVVETIPSPTKTTGRKRRKYEKVDKLHFFSLPTAVEPSPAPKSPSPPPTTLPPSEEHPKPVSVKVEDKPKTDDDSTTAELTSTNDEVLPEQQPTKKEIPVESDETQPTLKVDSSQDTSEQDIISNISRKRKTDQSGNNKPHKIGKFVPKLSLVDAVLQVKEQNKPEVIQLDDNIEGLKNLAIVEVVGLISREKKDKVENTDKYAGRKNFKKFKKGQKTSQEAATRRRRTIGFFTVEDRLNADDDDDEDDEDAGDFKNFKKPQQQHEQPRRRTMGLFTEEDDFDEDDDE
ncbi:hypothetical protein SBY92_003475 [Candida maltosa Xu316]